MGYTRTRGPRAGGHRRRFRADGHPPGPYTPQPGDFILCHRKGIVSAIIRWGERLRWRSGARWSHAAFVVEPGVIVEALTRSVVRSPLSEYDSVDHLIVQTNLDPLDARQAVAFAQSCLRSTTAD